MTPLDDFTSGGRPEDWINYRMLILSQLENLQGEIKALRQAFSKFREEEMAQVKTEIALLKFKSGMWGGAIGMVGGGVVTLVVQLLLRGLH